MQLRVLTRGPLIVSEEASCCALAFIFSVAFCVDSLHLTIFGSLFLVSGSIYSLSCSRETVSR